MNNQFEHPNYDQVSRVTDAFGLKAGEQVAKLATSEGEEILAVANLVNALKEAGHEILAQELLNQREKINHYYKLIEMKKELEPKKRESIKLAKEYVAVNEKLVKLAPDVHKLLKEATEAIS